jgi:protein-disulfide isomerase
MRGKVDAPLSLLEYGDYECVYCGQAYPVIEKIRRTLGDRLRFVHRHFPLTQIHPHAHQAAEATEAAGAQGRFWEMHDTLFTHQRALDDAHLTQYAISLGLDMTQFTRALNSHVFAVRARQDFIDGIRSGVNGTPAFFINEVRYNGPHDFDSLVTAIENTYQLGAA